MKYYHGTGLANYDAIRSEGVFKFTKRNDHWLGNGVYFFVGDFKRAKLWAEGNRPDKSTPPVVLEVDLDFQEDLLDLDLTEDLNELDKFARQYKLELQRRNIQLRNTDEKGWQCRLIDAFMAKNRNYSAICRTFESSGNPIVGLSRFIPLAKQLNVVKGEIIDIDGILKYDV